MSKFHIKDFGLRAEQLAYKYRHGEEGYHPTYTPHCWREAVESGNTDITGYWEWVRYQITQEELSLESDNPYNN